MTDDEWQDVLEVEDQELSVRVWHAEATLEKARADTIERNLYYAMNPIGPVSEADREQSSINIEHLYRKQCKVERAAYGWRRDYGEWPSSFNLTDRLANEAGISHGAARTRIQQAVNDPSPKRHLHIIPAERLAEILNDEPNTCGPWAGPVESVRFYVAAEGHRRLEDRYDVLALIARLAAA